METGYAKILDTVQDKITVETPKDFKPDEFFKSGDNLYVSSDFTNSVVKKSAEPFAESRDVSSWKLLVSANDATIESALQEEHIFSENEVSAILASLISKQLKGEDGTLLNDGSWNLFYTPEFVVCVRWDSASRRWRVNAWGRDDGAWGGGFRVFAPAN